MILRAESALDAVHRHEGAEIRNARDTHEDDASNPLVATMLKALHSLVPYKHNRSDDSTRTDGMQAP